WPTTDAFLFAKNFLGSAFPALWTSNSDLAARAPELSQETKRLGSPGPPKGSSCQTLEGCDSHARRVDLSLDTMRKFARSSLGDDPCDILYVPLTASQQGSTDFLRVLWNLLYAAGTPGAPTSPTFFQAEANTKSRQEQEFLASLEGRLHGSE